MQLHDVIFHQNEVSQIKYMYIYHQIGGFSAEKTEMRIEHSPKFIITNAKKGAAIYSASHKICTQFGLVCFLWLCYQFLVDSSDLLAHTSVASRTPHSGAERGQR